MVDVVVRSMTIVLDRFFVVRRPFVASGFAIAGTAMLLSLFFDRGTWVVSALVVLALNTDLFVFTIVWVYAAEMHPTPIR